MVLEGEEQELVEIARAFRRIGVIGLWDCRPRVKRETATECTLTDLTRLVLSQASQGKKSSRRWGDFGR